MDLIKNYDAFIFDFDGVVCDTEKLHFIAWNKGFATLGFALTEEEYLPLKSTGRNHIVATAAKKLGREILPFEAENINRIKDATFKELSKNIDKSLLIPGVEDFLIKLKNKGAEIAVASSASTTTELVKKLGLGKYFEVIVDGNMKLPKKPAPDIFLTAAKKTWCFCRKMSCF